MTGWREFLKVYGLIVAIVAAGFWVAFQFVSPPPPRALRMATGAPGGAYAEFGQRYRDILRRDGFEVELVPSAGSVENLKLLADPARNIDVAFMQGGVGTAEGQPGLQALASIFLEPMWVYVRRDLRVRTLADLKGRRVAVGAEGSGTRSLALQLLGRNGVEPAGAELLALGGDGAAEAMREGRADAAFFVSYRPSPAIVDLMRDPGLVLLSFERAEAYRLNFPFLSAVTLPGGAVSLGDDLPPRDTILLAPAAALVARDTLHPAHAKLLAIAAREVHAARQTFSAPGTFPSVELVDFPLNEDAARTVQQGPTFLFRWLPFQVAILVERMMVLAIPLLTLVLPLMRVAPPAYRWQVRRKIYRWYSDLRRIEREARGAGDPESRRKALDEIDRVERQVAEVKVPDSYAEYLYHLRLHIDLLRVQLARPPGP